MGARQVREFIVQNGIGGLLAAVQIAVALGVMAVYSPHADACLPRGGAGLRGPHGLLDEMLRPLFAELEESYGKYASFQIDAIKGIETVKATAAEMAFRDAMLGEFTAVAGRQFRANFVDAGVRHRHPGGGPAVNRAVPLRRRPHGDRGANSPSAASSPSTR